MICGGADGTQTHDRYDANVALYQLSYNPKTAIAALSWQRRMVGIRRLELPRVAPLVPETSASTNSAICPQGNANDKTNSKSLQVENVCCATYLYFFLARGKTYWYYITRLTRGYGGMVDAEDLKSFGHCDRVGSSPTIPTTDFRYCAQFSFHHSEILTKAGKKNGSFPDV